MIASETLWEAGPEAPALGCFLCDPPEDLLYKTSPTAFALCGLGPLTSSYSLVATRRHIPSCADAVPRAPAFATFLIRVRRMLTELHGSCLVTEHGRLPVCVDTMTSDRHCYHAHFLLFPGAPTVIDTAARYFASVVIADSLNTALRIARTRKEYFLLSPTPQQFFVMSQHKTLPRQFARLLVATATGFPEGADWRRHPDRPRAVAMAKQLRDFCSP